MRYLILLLQVREGFRCQTYWWASFMGLGLPHGLKMIKHSDFVGHDGIKLHFRGTNRSLGKTGCWVALGVHPSFSHFTGRCISIPLFRCWFLEREGNFLPVRVHSKFWSQQDYLHNLFCGDSFVLLGSSYVFRNRNYWISDFAHPGVAIIWVGLGVFSTSLDCCILVG